MLQKNWVDLIVNIGKHVNSKPSKVKIVNEENVVALVIPIGIVLLASAIVAICCFKKKADIAKRENAKIIERLPDFGENQASTRSNKGSKFNSFFKIGSSKEAPHKESFVLDDAPRG